MVFFFSPIGLELEGKGIEKVVNAEIQCFISIDLSTNLK